MKKMLAIVAGVAAMAAEAKIDVDASDTTVTPGTWCGNFAAATNYVSQNDIPLVLVWGVTTQQYGECEHCAALTAALKTSDGAAWVAATDAVFCFVEGYNWADTGANANSGAMTFARSAAGTRATSAYLNTTPFVCLYWPGRNAVAFTGMVNTMYSTDGTTLLGQFQNSVEKFISEVDAGASYTAFPFGNTENDRLEVVSGETQYIDVPVVRTNMTETTAKCAVSFGNAVSNLVWKAGETMKFARFALEGQTQDTNGTYTLMLTDSKGTNGVRHVWTIEECENSAKNPYWIGERTAETLEWGEWTMDFDIVTNKVAAFNAANPDERSYALILVEGSCWCPDCAMGEANFFDRAEFKEWAETNHIALGALDIPNNPNAANPVPSLLRYDTYRTSNAFVTLRETAEADETKRYQSGAGYLSRHSIDYAAAQEATERNRLLMSNDTLNGGWNRPERTNKNRTGVPVLLLLREDGSVAARWNRFSDVGPGFFSEGYLRRLEEMFAAIGDADEESDSDATTTERTIAPENSVSGTVSTTDQADVFKIDADLYTEATFTLTGGVEAAELSVTVLGADRTNIIATASGSGASGVTLSLRIEEAPCWLKIAPKTIADGTYFGYTNSESTVCGYAATFVDTASGGDIGFTRSAMQVSEAEGIVSIGVERAKGSAGSASVTVTMETITDPARATFAPQTLSWGDGESGVKYATLTVVDDNATTGETSLRLALAGLAGERVRLADGAETLDVTIVDDDLAGTLIDRNVAWRETIELDNWQDGDGYSLRKLSGSLPEGLTLKVADGKVVVSGTPRAPGVYSCVWRIEVKRGGATVSTAELEYEFTVRDNDFAAAVPSLAKTRTYSNLAAVGDDGYVRGLVTLTVPATGRLSAKYVAESGTYRYSAKSWDSFSAADATLTATLAATKAGVGDMVATLAADGGTVEFSDPADGAAVTVSLPVEEWSAANPAAAWGGQYTVQMPQTNVVDGAGGGRLGGTAYMAMRMTTDAAKAAGKMLYAGVLPNGRAFSGYSTLAKEAGGAALMPFCRRGAGIAPYSVSGAFAVAPNAAAGRPNAWSVVAGAKTRWASADAIGHEADLEVYGGYFNASMVQTLFDGDFSGATDDFWLKPVQTRLAMSGGVPAVAEGADNPNEATLRFSTETGIVSGEFYVETEDGPLAVLYRAAALPGWQICAECTLGDGVVERPWAAGSYSFTTLDGGTFYRDGGEASIGRHD